MATAKYNRSAIMKAAWMTKRMYGTVMTFGECLKSAWRSAKVAMRKAEAAKAPVKTPQQRYNEMREMWNRVKPESKIQETVRTYSEADQKALIDYYANNRYNGD